MLLLGRRLYRRDSSWPFSRPTQPDPLPAPMDGRNIPSQLIQAVAIRNIASPAYRQNSASTQKGNYHHRCKHEGTKTMAYKSVNV